MPASEELGEVSPILQFPCNGLSQELHLPCSNDLFLTPFLQMIRNYVRRLVSLPFSLEQVKGPDEDSSQVDKPCNFGQFDHYHLGLCMLH